jgi:hypothetical protein
MTKRIVFLAALALLLVGCGARAPQAHAAAAPSAATASLAAIDLHGLFGDENEPDENEPDEGAPAPAPTERGPLDVSLPVVLVLVALAALAGGYVAIHVRRAWLRLVVWTRGLWARL